MWQDAINADPRAYSLTANYGPWAHEKAAERFELWHNDMVAGKPSPALCRRCGRILHSSSPGQQLHPDCTPPVPSGKPPAQPSVSELRREMADTHPDRGGTNEAFIAARQRYVRARRAGAP